MQSHLRAETESRYWLDGKARALPEIGVLGEAFRAARTPFAQVASAATSCSGTVAYSD